MVPAALGALGGAWLCVALDQGDKAGWVMVLALVGIALLPTLSVFREQAPQVLLFAVGATLSVSAKFHLAFRPEHLGGAIGLRVSITDLLLLLVALAVVPRAARRSIQVEIDRPILVSFACYLAWAVLSVVGSGDRILGVYQVTALLEAFLVFVVLANTLSSRARLVAFIAGVLCGLLLQSVVAIAQVQYPGSVRLEVLGAVEEVQDFRKGGKIDLPSVDLGTTIVEGEVARRPTGLLIHPNVLANYLILAMPMAFAAWLVLPSAFLRLVALLAIGNGGLALYLSLSRSGWLGAALAMLLGMALTTFTRAWRLTRAQKIGLAVLAIAAVAGLAMKADRLQSRLTETAGEAFDFRRDLALAAWSMTLDNPVTGVGLNTFINEVRDYDTSGMSRLKPYPAHNVYLLETSETGLPGGIAFAMLVLTMAWRTLRAASGCIDPRARTFALFVAASIVAFWFVEIADFVYRIPVLTTLLWAQVALVFAIARLDGQAARAEAA
jgi:hypothetical protein